MRTDPVGHTDNCDGVTLGSMNAASASTVSKIVWMCFNHKKPKRLILHHKPPLHPLLNSSRHVALNPDSIGAPAVPFIQTNELVNYSRS